MEKVAKSLADVVSEHSGDGAAAVAVLAAVIVREENGAVNLYRAETSEKSDVLWKLATWMQLVEAGKGQQTRISGAPDGE